jgi:hypothetical protein
MRRRPDLNRNDPHPCTVLALRTPRELAAGLHGQQLRAELSTSGEPGRGVAQVDRQLPGAEIPILGQAAADVASAISTARRTSAACVLGSARQPCWPSLADAVHIRSAAAYRGRTGFQLATRRMAASNAAASSSATATATTCPPGRGGAAAAAGGSCSDGVIPEHPGRGGHWYGETCR